MELVLYNISYSHHNMRHSNQEGRNIIESWQHTFHKDVQ
jgi:hypothetical protein